VNFLVRSPLSSGLPKAPNAGFGVEYAVEGEEDFSEPLNLDNLDLAFRETGSGEEPRSDSGAGLSSAEREPASSNSSTGSSGLASGI